MACSWPGSERFLGPGFCLISGRCSCLSSARVNSAEPSGRPLKVLSRMAFRLDSGWVRNSGTDRTFTSKYGVRSARFSKLPVWKV
jgi:hypothetical protein